MMLVRGVAGLAAAAAALLLLGLANAAQAEEMVLGGKLLLTRGVASLEGSGGGGLATWALITGNETEAGIGADAHATYVHSGDYDLRAVGGAVGMFDRLEFSYARQSFDTGGTGEKLGLGRGFTFDQDVVGVKLRVFGDAVYGQDTWLPQVAVGAQYKHNNRRAIVRAVGGRDDDGADFYIAATKVLLDKSLVLDATMRFTKANQIGLLGYGGDRSNDYSTQFEGSAGYLVSRRLLVGAEYRTKPNNLGFAKEDDWYDLFAAYALNHNISVTAAYANLGDIATFRDQRAVYLSLQAAF